MVTIAPPILNKPLAASWEAAVEQADGASVFLHAAQPGAATVLQQTRIRATILVRIAG